MAVIPSSNGSSGGFRENAEAVRADVERGRSELRAIGARGREITDDLRELARLEADLARAELNDNRRALQSGAVSGTLAGVFAFWILGFLGGAMTFALNEFWPAWAAALATAGTFLVIAAVAGLIARSRFKQFSPTPRRTIASIREDITWLRTLTKQNAASASSGR
ncbi:MAG: phage holin family protein [Dehalococcoidia bacterium]